MREKRAATRGRFRAPASAVPRALSADAWYTLIYLTPSERERLHARRRKLWSAPLLRGGLDRPRIDVLLREFRAARARWEAAGRTPPLPAQVGWLARRSGVRLDADALTEELDLTLLRTDIRVAAHSARVLAQLDDDGVPLAVISNVLNETGFTARSILDRLGLLPYFRLVYLSCDRPWSKPSPQPFREVARYLRVPAKNLLHVGDLRYDVDGAHRAGALGVLFTEFDRWNRYLPGVAPQDTRLRYPSVANWRSVLRLWRELTRGSRGDRGA